MPTHDNISPTTQRFFDAIGSEDTATIREMAAGGFDIAAAEAEYGEGAMERAISFCIDDDRDPTPVLECLMALGADINAAPDQTTPLMIAVWQCNAHLAEWLILHGADVNAILEEDGWTSLDYAYMDQQVRADKDGFHTTADYQRLINMLERHGAKMAQDLPSCPSPPPSP